MTPPPQPEYIITEEQVDEWLSHWVEKYQDIGKEVKAWLKENSRSHPYQSSRDTVLQKLCDDTRTKPEEWELHQKAGEK